MSQKPAQFDVIVGKVPWEDIGDLIVQHLAIKGFCSVELGLRDGIARQISEEVGELDAQQRLQPVNATIAEGLLGVEGSARIAQLETPEPQGVGGHPGTALGSLDHTLMEVGLLMGPHAGRLGFDLNSRCAAVLHRAGEPAYPAPRLGEADASAWLSVFLRHRVMMVVFLGPSTGVLELVPYDLAHAHTYKIRPTVGTMVVLRPDILSHKYYASPSSFALSAFCLPAARNLRNPAGNKQMIPAARELDEWIMSRLQELKEREGEAATEPGMPPGWHKAMNQSYHAGQMIAVRSAACQFPFEDEFDTWFRACNSGPDYVTEVPQVRWDHAEVYDPDPESWRRHKSCCRHASFVDGTELFDCNAFQLPVSEARSMDPHHRMVLEVGYSAFYRMDLRRGKLVNWPCGVYVGCGNNEWLFVPKATAAAACPPKTPGSGRFSYVLGLKGPSMTVDTEASSGMVALYLAAESVQQVGGAHTNQHAIAFGAHLCLAPTWWPSHCASGWLSGEGRCFTFNATAAGYVRGEGCCAAVVSSAAECIDGQYVDNAEGGPLLGCIAGATMNSNGTSASLSTPNGPAEQEVMAEALQNARVSPSDVDCIEAHGAAHFLADAVEVGSFMRVYRAEEQGQVLPFTGLKTSVGNQIECGGIAAFLKALFAAQWGLMTPNLHLNQINPHIDAGNQPSSFANEASEFAGTSLYIGVMSRGFGGSNVHALAWGHVSDDRVPQAQPLAQQGALAFWPGGGGILPQDMCPDKAYTIVGTWSQWKDPRPMEKEGSDTFGFTVTLGENRWEQFQIWLDGDSDRVLHPGQPKASKESHVCGPEPNPCGCNWIIDGRPRYVAALDESAEGEHKGEMEGKPAARLEWERAKDSVIRACESGTEDTGRPGDQYRVRLRIAGQWRTVSWDKLCRAADSDQVAPTVTSGRYYIAADWNDWDFEEIASDPSAPGVFRREVALQRDGGYFQVVRDRDWAQVLYPAIPGGGGACEVLGPDDEGSDLNWFVDGKAGDVFRVQFQRTFEEGADIKKVSWSLLHHEQLSDDQLVAASLPRYCILGTWSGWAKSAAMDWDGEHYRYRLRLGSRGEESFQILKDGHLDQVICPNCRDATPHSFHVLRGPGHDLHGLHWTVGRHERDGGKPGAWYEVRLVMHKDGVRPKRVEWAGIEGPPSLEDAG